MNRFLICLMVFGIICAGLSVAHAGECYSDMVVKRWLDERDRAEERVIQLWAKGHPPEDFASEVAVILANEFYFCSKCRDNVEFLRDNVHILKNGVSPKVETVPSIILERLVGAKLLSPWKQFPSDKRKGVAKVW